MSRPERHASSLLTDTQVLHLIQGMAPKKPTRSPDPQEALALMQQGRVRGHGRRSPIVIWMQKNRAALEQGFTETTPSWGKLATYLGDHGILDGDGKRPTAEATRQAWYRTKNMAPAKGRPADPVPAPPITPPLPSPTVASTEGDAPQPERPRFTFATLRNHTPPAPPPAPPPPPEPIKRDADAEIRRLIGGKPRQGFQPPDQQD